MKLSPGGSEIGRTSPCCIIAEIGTSHGGDTVLAKELIHAAAEAGADCAKFQIVFADEIIHPLTGSVKLPGGDIPLYEKFRELEQDEDFFFRLKEYCEDAGLQFLCSPFGIRSARILRALSVPAIKIASPELNHYPLLKEVTEYGIPLILSSGVSTLGDIEKALAITGRERTALLHCVTAYPAPEEEYNLSLLPLLSGIFGIPLGVSDHSLDPVLVPVLSVVSGGMILEKHFTISRNGSGLDDPIALPPDDFALMVREVRSAESLSREETLRMLNERYSPSRIEAVLGDGVKVLAPAEQQNYGRTNRSIHAVREIPAGTCLREEHISILRTEKVLRPGLSPEYFSLVLGKKTTRSIPPGEGVQWNDILLDKNC